MRERHAVLKGIEVVIQKIGIFQSGGDNMTLDLIKDPDLHSLYMEDKLFIEACTDHAMVILLEVTICDLSTKTDIHHDGYWEDDHLIFFPRSTWGKFIGK